jgi:hypothetical protein
VGGAALAQIYEIILRYYLATAASGNKNLAWLCSSKLIAATDLGAPSSDAGMVQAVCTDPELELESVSLTRQFCSEGVLFFFFFTTVPGDLGGVIVINLHQVTEQYDPGITRQRTVDYQRLPVELSNRSSSIWPGVKTYYYCTAWAATPKYERLSGAYAPVSSPRGTQNTKAFLRIGTDHKTSFTYSTRVQITAMFMNIS